MNLLVDTEVDMVGSTVEKNTIPNHASLERLLLIAVEAKVSLSVLHLDQLKANARLEAMIVRNKLKTDVNLAKLIITHFYV